MAGGALRRPLRFPVERVHSARAKVKVYKLSPAQRHCASNSSLHITATEAPMAHGNTPAKEREPTALA